MKCLFILFLCLFSILTNAQNCNTSLLFKQGAVLEYKSWWGLDIFKRKFREVTQLVFTIREVKDSNNIKYSYITKTGINPVNPALKYEKQYIIACDGNKIAIPWDFYTPGIVYFSNRYEDNKVRSQNDTGVHVSATYKKVVLLNFPVGASNTRFSITGDQVIADQLKRAFKIDWVRGVPDATPGAIIESKNTVEATIIDLDKMESNTITTPAGTFSCIVPKIVVDPKKKNEQELGYKFYYTPEAGVVKVESLYSNFKHIAEYVELVSIKQ